MDSAEAEGKNHNQWLFSGAEAGDVTILASLAVADWADTVQTRDDQGRTALMVAAQYGSYPFVREIIRMGASTTDMDTSGKSAYEYLEQFGSALLNRIAQSHLDAAYISAVITKARAQSAHEGLNGRHQVMGDDIL